MRRRLFPTPFIIVGLSLVGCTTTDPMRGQYAEDLKQQGDFATALTHSKVVILDRKTAPSQDDARRHTEILRGLERNVEADAFEEFTARYFSGKQTNDANPDRALRSCQKTQALQRGKRRLIWLPRHRRVFTNTQVAVRYAVGASGLLTEIRILRARDPTVAWSVIGALASAPVAQYRLSQLDRDEFPIEHCIHWSGEKPAAEAWIPPRVRNNW